MVEPHFGHVEDVGEEQLGAVTGEGGQEGEERGQETRPGGDVGVQEAVHVYTTPCAQHQGQQEEEGEDGEGDGGLVAEEGGPEADDGGADGLEEAGEGGQGGQEYQEEQQPRPQPARGDGGQGGLHYRDPGHEEAGPRDGDREAGLRGQDVGQVDGLEAVGDPEEAEHEQDGEHGPDQVGGDHDGGVPHQVVVVAVVAGEGGHGAQAELETEDDLGGCSLSTHDDKMTVFTWAAAIIQLEGAVR